MAIPRSASALAISLFALEFNINQVPICLQMFSYDLDATNRFLTVVYNIVQEAVIKTIPKKKECKKVKLLSEEALQIVEKRSEMQRRKEKIYSSECRVPKKSKER